MEKTDISLENELNQLDIAVNEKIKYCSFQELDESGNSLNLVLDIKDILLLMTSEIKSLKLQLLQTQNKLKQLEQLIW